jgi:tetratricopeptide (TPR) repeat protein
MKNLISLARKTKRWQHTGFFINNAIKNGANSIAGNFFLGLVCKNMGDANDALSYFQNMLLLAENNYKILLSLAKIASDCTELEVANEIIKRAIVLNKDTDALKFSAVLLNNMACQYKTQGNVLKAKECYKQALDIDPNNAAIYRSFGVLLFEQSDYYAIQYFKRAVDEEPDNPDSLNNLSVALLEQGNLEMALRNINRAVEVSPDNADIRANRAKILLLMGDMETGLKENEWRVKRPVSRDFYYQGQFNKQPWQGEFFSGKRLLIYSEQGYGDIIQFSRYLPLIKNRGGIVLFSTRKELLDIFADLPGIDYLLEQNNQVMANTDFDLIVPLMSLPLILGTTMRTIPYHGAYINADLKRVSDWRNKIPQNNNLKVGVVWAAKFTDLHSKERSCGFKALAPLFNIQGIDYYSLQKGEGASQIVANEIVNLVDHTELLHTFADTAALIANLDLVITVDTSVAHLAGAMGKPVWTMLRFVPDWRWGMNGEDSPWYPTMRLFRQNRPGDWKTVIERVAYELDNFIKNKKHLVV